MNKISNTCYSSHFDVTIIGAGLAGLQCARDLSAKGISVLLVDRKSDLTKGVPTTGIFVRKDRVFRFDAVDDLVGKHFGYNRGYALPDELNKMVLGGEIVAEEVGTTE